MKNRSPVGLIITIVLVALAVYSLKDSFVYYSKTPAQQKQYRETHPKIHNRIINMGLDLQGGMRLVLEIDRSSLEEEEKKNVLDRAYTIIQNRIDGLGVQQPTIQKQGKNRLIVELPGLTDEQTAKRVIGSTAQLEFHLLAAPQELSRAVEVIDRVVSGQAAVDSTGMQADSADTGDAATGESQTQAEQLFGAQQQDSLVAADSARARPEEITSFRKYLVQMGQQIAVAEKNRDIVEEILDREDVQQGLERAGLGANLFLWGHGTQQQNNNEYRQLYYLRERASMKGDVITEARERLNQQGMQAGNYVVTLEMNSEGRRTFRRVTGANVNKYLAIVLDSTVYSAPQIQQKISRGRAEITGDFTLEEAKNLAIVLQAGALPAPVKIIEQRMVGPSLGQDSINKGFIALVVGFVIVVVFMAVYYKLAGIIADVAVLLNLIFILAIMATPSINATLTLPGIAGIILIVGMSVDACVLIFERIREELDLGKTVRSSIEAGYSRAALTIMDANITTLITAVILFWVGTGPVKGFAVTLIIGIIVSLFTSLYITRVLFNMTTQRKQTKLSI
jgi:protein-export membrane protein SecD